MALTVSIVDHWVAGDRKTVVADVTFDSSYDTGGETVDYTKFGFRRTISSFPDGVARNATTGAVLTRRSVSTGKLQAFWQTDPGAAGGAAIPFPEVTSTTNLSAYTVRVTVIGK